MSKVKKYLSLDERISKGYTQLEKFTSFQNYDHKKIEIWENKIKALHERKDKLTKTLTKKDKEEIETFYQVGDMFD